MYSQIVGQVVLLQRVRLEAMGHRVKILAPNATDKTLSLQEKIRRHIHCLIIHDQLA